MTIEERLTAVEQWIEAFEKGCEQAEKELEMIIEFAPDPTMQAALTRDKKKDN